MLCWCGCSAQLRNALTASAITVPECEFARLSARPLSQLSPIQDSGKLAHVPARRLVSRVDGIAGVGLGGYCFALNVKSW
eukprot:7280017-Pyramimonas_sp.AAC.1